MSKHASNDTGYSGNGFEEDETSQPFLLRHLKSLGTRVVLEFFDFLLMSITSGEVGRPAEDADKVEGSPVGPRPYIATSNGNLLHRVFGIDRMLPCRRPGSELVSQRKEDLIKTYVTLMEGASVGGGKTSSCCFVADEKFLLARGELYGRSR